MPLGLERELVLVAEDDAANRALLARLLERAGDRSVTVAFQQARPATGDSPA